MDAIETSELIKKYYRRSGFSQLMGITPREEINALNGVNMNVRKGDIYALLGPNGAGKTTLIKVLCNLVLPNSGTATIFGRDVVKESQKIRQSIGLVNTDERSFYWRLTGRQNLYFFASLYRLNLQKSKTWIDTILRTLGLQKDADVTFHYYSSGMKQRLAIARGMLHKPRILFMDEPTRSLDPISAKNVRAFIKEELLELIDGSIVLATHNLHEAGLLANRMAVMHKGKILAEDGFDRLQSVFFQFKNYKIELDRIEDGLLKKISSLKNVKDVSIEDSEPEAVTLNIKIARKNDTLNHILEQISSRGLLIRGFHVSETTLEDLFHTIILDAEKNV